VAISGDLFWGEKQGVCDGIFFSKYLLQNGENSPTKKPLSLTFHN
jgi:hypothetical protein